MLPLIIQKSILKVKTDTRDIDKRGQGQRGSVVSNNQQKVWFWEGRDQTVEEKYSFLYNLP